MHLHQLVALSLLVATAAPPTSLSVPTGSHALAFCCAVICGVSLCKDLMCAYLVLEKRRCLNIITLAANQPRSMSFSQVREFKGALQSNVEEPKQLAQMESLQPPPSATPAAYLPIVVEPIYFVGAPDLTSAFSCFFWPPCLWRKGGFGHA